MYLRCSAFEHVHFLAHVDSRIVNIEVRQHASRLISIANLQLVERPDGVEMPDCVRLWVRVIISKRVKISKRVRISTRVRISKRINEYPRQNSPHSCKLEHPLAAPQGGQSQLRDLILGFTHLHYFTVRISGRASVQSCMCPVHATKAR